MDLRSDFTYPFVLLISCADLAPSAGRITSDAVIKGSGF